MGQLGWVWFGGEAGEWDVVGNFGMSGPDGVVSTPPSGNNTFGYVSTSNGILGPPFVPLDGITGPVGSTQDGSSIISPLFSAGQNSLITLDINYVTSDGGAFADYAWIELLTEANIRQDVIMVFRTNSTTIVVPAASAPVSSGTINPAAPLPVVSGGPSWTALGNSSGTCFSSGCGYTGWVSVSYIIQVGGKYKLKIGIANWIDRRFASAIAVDSIKVDGNFFNPPLPLLAAATP